MFIFCIPVPLNLSSMNTFESAVISLTNMISISQAVIITNFKKTHVTKRPTVGIPVGKVLYLPRF